MGSPARFALLREHLPARRLARRLLVSDASSSADDRRALLTYWYGSDAAHLRAEDHVLMTAWNRHGGAQHPLNASMRDEFARLARRVQAVAGAQTADPAELRAIGHELVNHLTRQERELYGAVELALGADELDEVEETLTDLRRF
jgi:hypothetical protein